MKHTTFKLMTAAMIIAAMAALSGCAEKKPEIDFNLIGGEIQTEDSDYNVDIRKDNEDTPVNSDTESGNVTAEPEIITDSDIPKEEISAPRSDESKVAETPAVSEDKPDTTKPTENPTTTKPADTTKPAVTITTDKPKETTPAQTVRTDLPKVTAEPQYTTKATTTAKPAQTEPVEIKTDKNGFPANPVVDQLFTDSTGQQYIYDSIFGWIRHSGNGETIVQEIPNYDHSGNIILN